jgi:hypothetical protein
LFGNKFLLINRFGKLWPEALEKFIDAWRLEGEVNAHDPMSA